MDQLSSSTPEPLLLQAVHAVDMQLTKVRDLDPTFLSLPEKAELLRELVHVRAQVDGLLVDTLAVAADVADNDACTTGGSWLAAQAQVEPSEGGRLQRLAEAAVRWRRVREAMRDGDLSPTRAAAITATLDALGPDVSTAVREQAEDHLLQLAADHDVRELKRLGAAVLEVVDPDTYEAHEQARLEAELRKADEATRLSIRSRGDGTSRLTGVIPDAAAERLRTYLNAFSSPRHDAATDSTTGESEEPSPYLDPVTGKRLTGDRVRGEAFCAFLEAADPTRMPAHGGAATTVIVTMDLDKLREGLGWATTGDQSKLTPGEVRRLACQAQIIPAVLGGDSEVLDLGRTRRFFTPAQRKAIGLQWKSCAIDGCDVPGPWCEIHHLRPWSSGGKTELTNGIPLCPRHHHYVDDPRFDLTETPSGYQLHRRC
ncbi:hypothetical protein GCM10011584_15740 [Nocardioides phosphati]|uniref:HNH nuclease domain-containing protein n=1 Tax=Nocardioides phosphati TaxID=1867775 RepID=A0ABQ2NBE1_9ACTN|nr:HNH endonuclease signature motif containing protein [Nocardioides phosphati]GGO88529.1 hypothetical protein GCM10011584_15740 [Nocardioides phosphati]